MKKKETVKPQRAGGFRDYLPEQARIRQQWMSIIRSVMDRYGFSPLETPAVERRDVLTGGDEHFNKELFSVAAQEDGESDLALRFDLTVPLARVVAANAATIKFPFKRYQIGSVWRGERQQAGRYKEFIQCDADSVGSPCGVADAEIMALAYTILSALNVGPVRLRINNRKLLDGLSAWAEYEPEKNEAVIRVLDKMEKQGWDTVAHELQDLPETHLSLQQVSAIEEFLQLTKQHDDPMQLLDELEQLLHGVEVAQEGVRELRMVAEGLMALGVPNEAWRIDVSVARGLSYYTGPIFETVLENRPEIGSVCSGGRYDGLVERFGSIRLPSVGMSVGFDRLFEAVGETTEQIQPFRVAVLCFDEKTQQDVLQVSAMIRDAEIMTTLYTGQETSLKGQLSWAVAEEFGVAVLLGEKERADGVVQIKNLNASTQEVVSLDRVVDAIQTIQKSLYE